MTLKYIAICLALISLALSALNLWKLKRQRRATREPLHPAKEAGQEDLEQQQQIFEMEREQEKIQRYCLHCNHALITKVEKGAKVMIAGIDCALDSCCERFQADAAENEQSEKYSVQMVPGWQEICGRH